MTRAKRTAKILPFIPKPTTPLSKSYVHRHSDYHFLRQHTGEPPERTRGIRAWGHTVCDIGGLVLFLAVIIWLTCKL